MPLMKGATAPGFNREPDYPWREYDWEKKEHTLIPLFARLDSEGKLGEFIADCGCGDRPVSNLIPSSSGRKVFTLDSDPHSPRVRRNIPGHFILDLVGLTGENSPEAQRVMVDIFRACGGKLRRGARIEGFLDSMIFSDILNWLPDYQDVLRNTIPFLRPGGYLLIANQPGRGLRTLHHLVFNQEPDKGGPSDNSELANFLHSLDMGIESIWDMDSGKPVDAPDLEGPYKDRWLVFVARKARGPLISWDHFRKLRQSIVSLLERTVR